MEKDRCRDCIIIPTLFVTTMLVSLVGLYNGHNWGGDFSQYIAQARAIATNTVPEWYQKNSFIIGHSSDGLGALAYPWLFPLMIAPIWTIWGLNYIPYQVFLGFVFSSIVVSFYILLRKRDVSQRVAILFSALLLINSRFLSLTKSVLSDLPCLLFVMLSWIAIDWYLKGRTWKRAATTGFLCFLAFFTRTMGLAIISSLAVIDAIWLFQEIRTQKKQGIIIWKHLRVFIFPYLVFGLCWGITILVLPRGGSSYTTYFHFSLSTLTENACYYLQMIREFFIQEQLGNHQLLRKAATIAVCIPAGLLAMIGFLIRLKKRDHVPIYCAILMAMLCVYVYRQGTRFVISIYPAVLFFFYEGCRWLTKRKNWIRKAIAAYGTVACLLCFSCSVIVYTKTARAEPHNDVSNPEAMETYEYINRELNKDNVVYFERPRVLYLYTGVYGYVDFKNLDTSQADYVLVREGLGSPDLIKRILEAPDHYNLSFSNELFQLYQVIKNE